MSRVGKFLAVVAAAAAVALVIVKATGSDHAPPPPLSAGDRSTLERILARALADSAALANARFSLPVQLETSFGEDGATVSVLERFRLTKAPASAITVSERRQEIHGDRALLKSMYSFETSSGDLRRDTMVQLTSVGFGADQRLLVRDLLDGRTALDGAIVDSVAIDGATTRVVRFKSDGYSGSLAVDAASLAARHVMVRRETSSIVGGYVYAMTLSLTSPSSLRLPVRMHTEFEYERLDGEGAGVVTMNLDTAGLAAGR